MTEFDNEKPFYGFEKGDNSNPYTLVYEVWDNFFPDKIKMADQRRYIPGLLSEQQLVRMIPFWKESGHDLVDPIISLQLEKNGGSTVLYRFEGKNKEVPPNARCRIIKPIFNNKIEKLTVATEPGKSFVFHTSAKSQTCDDDIKLFVSIIERLVFSEIMEDILSTVPEMKNLNNVKSNFGEFDNKQFFLSNTFILDKRTNKIQKNGK